MIRILIADDHAIVRAGLKQIVAQEKDMVVEGEAGSVDELLQLLPQKEWSVLILDINMPGRSGLDVLKEIKTRYPALPVLILSIYDEEQYGLRAIRSGADGYLKKISAPEELISAIRKLISGGKYISPTLAERLANTFTGKLSEKPHEKLSPREYQVMCMIAEGKSAEEIGETLAISAHTVYSYRNRILHKLNIKSNIELTRYVLEHKLI
ncbi:response regulator [Calditrichota bacterium GD2]